MNDGSRHVIKYARFRFCFILSHPIHIQHRLPTISLSGHHPSSSPIHQRRHLSSTREMVDRPQSARFQTLFESALEAYGKMTGIKLAQHPLFMELQNCNPVGSITAFLQSQPPAFSDFTENDRLMGPIKVTVWILTTLSATASLDDAFDPVRQKALMVFHISDHSSQTLSPVNAIYAGLAILLAVCPVL